MCKDPEPWWSGVSFQLKKRNSWKMEVKVALILLSTATTLWSKLIWISWDIQFIITDGRHSLVLCQGWHLLTQHLTRTSLLHLTSTTKRNSLLFHSQCNDMGRQAWGIALAGLSLVGNPSVCCVVVDRNHDYQAERMPVYWLSGMDANHGIVHSWAGTNFLS